MGPDPGGALFRQLLKRDSTCPWRCAPGAPPPGSHRHREGPSQSERFRAGVGLPVVEEQLSQESMGADFTPPWSAKRGMFWFIQKRHRRRAGGACGRRVPVQGAVGNPQVRLQRTDPCQGASHTSGRIPWASLLQGLWILPRPLGQVTRPVVHQDMPAFEQVRAGIGRLDPVPDHMRQGRLDHLPGMIRPQHSPWQSLDRVPRRRGDEPMGRGILQPPADCSPQVQ